MVVIWTFVLLALLGSANCFQRQFPVREDDILDQFVEETALERGHFRYEAPPVTIPSYDEIRPQHPLQNGTKESGDSIPSGSRVTAASVPPASLHYNTIPGRSGLDYPVHKYVPLTTFYCYNQKHPGYYADPEAGCQVFHVCNLDGRQDSFLCPVGTVFNQPYFVCDWWFNVDCRQAPKYYTLNYGLHRVPNIQSKSSHSHLTTTGPRQHPDR